MRRSFFAILCCVLLSCVPPLSELAPFPCAQDGTCPEAWGCNAQGTCVRNALDSPCQGSCGEYSDLTCWNGFCMPTNGCHNWETCSEGTGRVCQSAQNHTGDQCVKECTAGQPCPTGFECKALHNEGRRGCLPKGYVYGACASVTAGSCATPPPATCGKSVVDCGSHFCVERGQCSGNGCTCETGYTSLDCTSRRPCSEVFCSSNYGCFATPQTLSCQADISSFYGTCTCKDGRQLSFDCGSPKSCDALCELQ